jgi:hypothetical protein
MAALALVLIASTAVHAATATVSTGTLTEEEVAGLVFMRQEEKLAHDVYIALGEQWGLPVFRNIAGAESNHEAQIAVLLERYGIEDPAAGLAVGEFADADLQLLYNELLAKGGLSLRDALEVGVTIEETDIADLVKRKAELSQTDIRTVYARLERGSQNHLRAFNRLLQRFAAG